jgi:hypothetical protein
MPLVSPGINVTVTDESFYVSAGPGTVPLIMIATEQDKLSSAGDSIAEGTTAANAGKLYLMTSQRELLETFGVPNFNNVGGSSQHGNELNEYGLLAAYSYLGNANRAYVLRADVDLAQLQPRSIAPAGDPVDGTYWVDTNAMDFGIHIWQTGGWAKVEPKYIVSDAADLPPTPALGNFFQGDFAVEVTSNAITIYRYSGSWIEVTASAGAWDYQVKKVYPTTQFAGGLLDDTNPEDAWINANQVDFGIKVWDADIGAFISETAPAFLDDASAEAFYGSALSDGDLYIRYGEVSEEFVIYRYDLAQGIWEPLVYQAGSTAPTTATEAGTLWYNNDVLVDLMIHDGTDWIEFAGTLSLQSSEPSAPATGDIWVDTDQLDEYPVIYQYDGSAWIQRDNTDQTTPNGVVFGDARTAPLEALDADAPDASFYPEGMLLWNTRYSSMNVKKWVPNYVFEGVLVGDRWVSESGNDFDGSLLAGRKAQRQVVVEALAASIQSNEEIRAEAVVFNLMSAPGYIELTDELIALNADRKEKGFIIADAPMRLAPSGTDLQAWATNSNNSPVNGEDGLIASDAYVGVYYPACLATNVDGESVVQPASHIMLRTMAYNDQVAYQWFAPAGLQRGTVQNAESVGYLDSEGEYVSVQLNEGQRDVLYTNNINPIAFIPGSGLIVYGQKTRYGAESALDRINVARLINYIRYQSEQLARPFLFEPNDQLTRANVQDAFDRFLAELITLRGLNDFLVVCDESNNTPARIDRNELWIDIAIQPIKAIEFINIPIRIRNTGADLS